MTIQNATDAISVATRAGDMGVRWRRRKVGGLLLVLAVCVLLFWWLAPEFRAFDAFLWIVLVGVGVVFVLFSWYITLRPGAALRWDTEGITVNGWFGPRRVLWADVRLLEDRSGTRLLLHKGDGGTVWVNWGGVEDPGLLTEVLRTHLPARFIEAANRAAFGHADPSGTVFPEIAGKPVVSLERIAWTHGKSDTVIPVASLLCVERHLCRSSLGAASLAYTFHLSDGSETHFEIQGPGFLVFDNVVRQSIPSSVPLWDFTSNVLLPTAADLSVDSQRLALARHLGVPPRQTAFGWVWTFVYAGWFLAFIWSDRLPGEASAQLIVKLTTPLILIGWLFQSRTTDMRVRAIQRSRIITERLGSAGANASR